MAQAKARRVVLLSVKPVFAERILDGTKRVEFRKQPFHPDVQYVALYASRPVQLVVGYFVIGTTINAKPKELWRRYSDVAGITRPDFMNYFAACDRGYGITVSKTLTLSPPQRLSALGVLVPPQSFVYLEREVQMQVVRSLNAGDRNIV